MTAERKSIRKMAKWICVETNCKLIANRIIVAGHGRRASIVNMIYGIALLYCRFVGFLFCFDKCEDLGWIGHCNVGNARYAGMSICY